MSTFLRILSEKSDYLIISLGNVAVGLAWLLESPNRTNGVEFETAVRTLAFLPGYSMRWWGGIALVFAVPAFVSAVRAYRNGSHHYAQYSWPWLGLVSFWSWWVIGWTIPATTAGYTPVYGFIALMFALRHVKLYRDSVQ